MLRWVETGCRGVGEMASPWAADRVDAGVKERETASGIWVEGGSSSRSHAGAPPGEQPGVILSAGPWQ